MLAATVIAANVVIPDAKRPGKRMPYITGVKVHMADNSWWFWSRKYGTWTQHEPGLPKFYKSGSPTGEVGDERVTKYGRSLHRIMGHCPQLIAALEDALATAA